MAFAPTYRRLRPFILAAYVLVVVVGFVYFNLRLTVEWVAIILFVAAILSGKALLFVRDWGVFVAVLLAWQLTGYLATTAFHFPWHLHAMIWADRSLFGGTVPTVWLQAHLYHPGAIEPWDILASTMYMLHFLTPMLSGFVLWMVNRNLFRKFAIAFVLVAAAGFTTYILYPAVPPWMAAQPLDRVGHEYLFPWVAQDNFPGGLRAAWAHAHIYLPGITNIFNLTMRHWFHTYEGTIFFGGLHLHYDDVAAIPSEHAAFPMLFFLFLRRQFGRPAYLALLYMALLVFSITYLGEHYVIDAILGFGYAIASFLVVMKLAPAVWSWFQTRRPQGVERMPGFGELEEA